MDDAVEAVIGITTSPHAERVRTLLAPGRYDKAEQYLSRHDWWRPAGVEDVSTDPVAAVRDVAERAALRSFERSGWVDVDVTTAAEQIVSGYFALLVADDGTVVFAPEGTSRYRSVR